MSHHGSQKEDLALTRRELLGRMGNGFAALGMVGLMASEGRA